jgi:hypothetical protein
MSKRRSIGDVIVKVENAGFVGQRFRGRIEPEEPDDPRLIDYCTLECGDDQCREWANIAELGADNKPTGGYAYHVSECQMEDVD